MAGWPWAVNFGSRGASVNLEVELESAVVDDSERFFDRIRQVFRLTQQAIDEELNRQQAGSASNHATNGNGHAAARNGNGHAATNGNGHQTNGNGKPRSNGRRATASQVRALHAIAARGGYDPSLYQSAPNSGSAGLAARASVPALTK